MTSDQLSYVLERKYIGCKPGVDFVIAESVTEDPETGELVSNGDAEIKEWHLTDKEQLSEERLEDIWEKLKEEYHGRPDREDSEMAKFISKRNKRNITVNEEL